MPTFTVAMTCGLRRVDDRYCLTIFVGHVGALTARKERQLRQAHKPETSELRRPSTREDSQFCLDMVLDSAALRSVLSSSDVSFVAL